MLFAVLFLSNIDSSYETARQAQRRRCPKCKPLRGKSPPPPEKQPAVAAKADALASSKDIDAARDASMRGCGEFRRD